ncbi:MAG: thioredoxin family protein [Betaproteobacteria bacterium]|nr:thioredoxin family protein [Betaproteobacteria bacterium]
MAALNPPPCDFGWKAPDFDLPSTGGRGHTLKSVAGPRGLLLMFLCNHCPYVKTALPRILEAARELQALGLGVAAISSNDPAAYPEDSFDKMALLAEREKFPFPYLYDAAQEVARAYGAVCTPDFFGFNAALELQYRGRIDDAGMNPATPKTRHELLEAMRSIAATGKGPQEQWPSIGCSIKWRDGY